MGIRKKRFLEKKNRDPWREVSPFKLLRYWTNTYSIGRCYPWIYPHMAIIIILTTKPKVVCHFGHLKRKKNLLPFLDRKKRRQILVQQKWTLHEFMLGNKRLIFALQMEKYLASNEPNCISITLHASQIITRFKISGLNFVPLISCMRRNSRNLCSANFQFFWRIRRKVQVWTLAANLTSRKHGTRANCVSDFLFFHFLKLKC